MRRSDNIPLVSTVKERCRVCYTCVRECPAKAIRIADGQAEVLAARCIGCGNCVRVCGQQAKQTFDSTKTVWSLLEGKAPVAACLAPSFPAEFADCDYRLLAGMIRALGFKFVNEVAFGADLVADRYRALLQSNGGQRYIATSCPAVVAFVERYHPNLVPALAPVVSPMIATARVLRQIHGGHLRLVFIGPCLAKKGEVASERLPGELDAALTFSELRHMFSDRSIAPDSVEPSDFDPPHGGVGALFPISRGLLQAAALEEDLLTGEVVSADGKSFVDAIKEFYTDELDVQLLDVLACQGCISGPGIDNDMPLFQRRRRVSRFVRGRSAEVDMEAWQRDVDRFAGLDLTRSFEPDDQRIKTPSSDELCGILARLGKIRPEDELNCGACGYESCREHAAAIYKGMAESEMCLPYAIDQLKKTVKDLAISNEELAKTQQALVHSEKLATMGQLAAGIAHELNNPLGVVLMYAHILKDEHGPSAELRDDLKIITDQADRCKKIVGELLDFARENKVERRRCSLRELLERSLEAAPVPRGVAVEIVYDQDDLDADLDRDQMVQVLTNLFSNAYAAMQAGGRLEIRVRASEESVEVRISDNGTGIAKKNLSKIFEPFFTTKGIGKGTGLGLAVTYGIIKMHCGDIRVASNADRNQGPTGTTFTIILPQRAPARV